ncbi:hypothetical protein BTW14_gp187 [BeAn 58058 virus]|uniref:hypothetical protein n=1 Tax=BeAn 58058 virus TaxID=67082 RepID=UPI00090CAFB3|nr:hypothetical protein BTW14_gp187 [BeAn 58058 virus]APG58378.1 hypothetical protein BAV00204 [BeAn 58058 virus]
MKIIPCTLRNKNLYFGDFISSMVYLQSIDLTYGDGNIYTFKSGESRDRSTMRKNNKNNIKGCEATLDLTSREVTVTCPEFTIPRNISKYEGLCFTVTTSKDHCATDNDWLKVHGYNNRDALTTRSCSYRWATSTRSLDYYCSHEDGITVVFPSYDPCKSYILIEYRDTWIESNVLQKPPYMFEFIHDNSNEYVDSELSAKLNNLYDEYKNIMEYTDGSLPASINRLAKALTAEGRVITSVNIDGNLLDIAYQADKEKINEIQSRINELTRDIFIHTLSDKDIKDIIESEENKRCCIIDVKNNHVEKYYPIDNYLCGSVDDYIYTDASNTTYVLVNETFIEYDYLKYSGIVTLSCYEMTIIPLDTKTAIDSIEDEITSNAIAEALNELFEELDYNVSAIIIKDEDEYMLKMDKLYYFIVPVSCVILIILSIILILIIRIIMNKNKKT